MRSVAGNIYIAVTFTSVRTVRARSTSWLFVDEETRHDRRRATEAVRRSIQGPKTCTAWLPRSPAVTFGANDPRDSGDDQQLRQLGNARFRRPQLNDEAAAYIRDMIISGELPSGSFIRPERIARVLESSITPVREALLALRTEGFVEQSPRRGFVVSSISGRDIRDLFAAQALLAGELAARGALKCSTDHVRQIRAVQNDLDLALREGRLADLEALNHDFHRLINRSADSPRMAWLLGLATLYVPRRFFATIHGWPEASVYDHGAVIEAFEARDADSARAAMTNHFTHAGELLANRLDAAPRSGKGDGGEAHRGPPNQGFHNDRDFDKVRAITANSRDRSEPRTEWP